MKFLIIGCGSIGQRHIKNLLMLGYKEIIGFDVDKELLSSVKKKFSIKVSNEIENSISEADAVLICVPHHLHTIYALKYLRQGKHIFIEKPISHELEGLDRLQKIAEDKNCVVQIGYNLRYHPLLIKTKELLDNNTIGKIYSARIEYGSYLPNWRPSQDYTKNYSAHKSMGGGIILDDIHEINYAVWLFGKIKEVFCSAHKISNLGINTEDTAEIILKTEKGFNINIHMDYLQKEPTRKFKIVGEKGNIGGDLNKNHLKIFTDEGLNEIKEEFDYNRTYINELKDFINCIKNNNKPRNSFEEGIYDLKIASMAKKSSQEKKVITL